jgi:hypothetical protein
VREPLLTDATRSMVPLILLALTAHTALSAQSITPPALRAAFLLNFAKFVEWPVDQGEHAPLYLCVLDDAAVEDALAQLMDGGPVSGRSITLARHVRPRALRGCHVLYVGDTDPDRTATILDELKHAPVLTVGDSEAFATGGGMIGLFVEDGRMRFAINPDAALRAGLKLSSRLLNLARIVKEGRHGHS